MNEPEYINAVTKRLYPEIAKKNGTTASRVERSIRHAIYVTWTQGGPEIFNKALESRAFTYADKPTNCEMIALLSERVRYRLGRWQ